MTVQLSETLSLENPRVQSAMLKRLHIKPVIEAGDSSASGSVNKHMLHCRSQELEWNAANSLLAEYLPSCSPYPQGDPSETQHPVPSGCVPLSQTANKDVMYQMLQN